jgi:hypothetical protein
MAASVRIEEAAVDRWKIPCRNVKQLTFVRCMPGYLHVRRLSFSKSEAWSLPLSDDGKFPDYAEVWVEANRSRARILARYFAAAGAAFVRRWIGEGGNVADRATPRSLAGRTEVAIAERAVCSGSK